MLRFVFAGLGTLCLVAITACLASMYGQIRLYQRLSNIEKQVVMEALLSEGMADQVEILLTTDGHAVVCSDGMSAASANRLRRALKNAFGKLYANRTMSGVLIAEKEASER
ncbi:MAG TPA: hypothetical protein DDW52_18845 [Planctomycetaceae bacterium]|nr:hypothetical protein [Planctomycetaceae bacterium]